MSARHFGTASDAGVSAPLVGDKPTRNIRASPVLGDERGRLAAVRTACAFGYHARRFRLSAPMWYAITGIDHPDSLARRQSVRPAHLERLQKLHAEGRLLLAGPFPAIDAEDPGDAGFTGSLIIAAFESLGAAKAWADADPYIAAGVYREVRVQPFRKVLP